MTNEEKLAKLWTRESILDVENKILQQAMSVRTQEGSQASIAFARFLKISGMTAENYPLFLKMLEIENHWVPDALIGEGDPFLLLSTIPPNQYLTSKCFTFLTRWKRSRFTLQPSGMPSSMTGSVWKMSSRPCFS